MGKLKKIEINKALSGGDFETDALILEGNYATAEVTFDNLAGSGCGVTLQTSPDGQYYGDVPDSAISMGAGDDAAHWDIGPYPQDTRVRVKVSAGSSTGNVKLFKLKCDERKC